MVDNPPLRARWVWREKRSSSVQGAVFIGTGLKLGGSRQKQGTVAFHLKYEVNLCSMEIRIFQVVIVQNQSPITCTFLYLQILQLVTWNSAGKKMNTSTEPPWSPLIHNRTAHSYELQAPVKAPLSFPSQLCVLFHAPGFISRLVLWSRHTILCNSTENSGKYECGLGQGKMFCWRVPVPLLSHN